MDQRPLHLAVDAGGTSTRAVVCTSDGTCVGYATGSASNPTSAGPGPALAALTATTAAALADGGRRPDELGSVLVAMAGLGGMLPLAELAASIGYAGDPARLRVGPDILAIYFSGSTAPDGGAVVAGTGSAGAQVRSGRVVRAVGGCGWLLGDGGSGFAVGHAVVRAVVAELEGTGPATALTDLLLGPLGLEGAGATESGRSAELEQLMALCYAERPVSLARHAPLAFAAGSDPVARALVRGAQDDLARLVQAVRRGAPDGPLVLGGSVMHRGLLAPGRERTPALERALAGADVRSASDGAVGAAVAALAALGGPDGAGSAVPDAVVERLHRTVAERSRRRPAAAPSMGQQR